MTKDAQHQIRHRIFIGGTGRCGTGELLWWLGQHPDIHAIPAETRFIVDPDGLAKLSRILTIEYTPDTSYTGLKRFDELMRFVLGYADDGDFKETKLYSVFGREHFLETLRQLMVFMTHFEYTYDSGSDLVDGYCFPSTNQKRRVVIPRYFEDPTALTAAMARFVDRLFSKPALESGKIGWCEKTPFNILEAPFLWTLFPDATLIHITRDPRGVLESMQRQRWAPDDPNHVMVVLNNIYARWAHVKEAMSPPSPEQYIEVKLEDLAADPQLLNRIVRQMGLPEYDSPVACDPHRIYAWQRPKFHETANLCTRSLAPYFPLMGYEI